jgi:hypothetical protein
VIDEQFRLEILDWIANDPDPETASLLENWLVENNEAELRRSFNGLKLKGINVNLRFILLR